MLVIVIARTLPALLQDPDYPCLGAQAAIRHDAVVHEVFGCLNDLTQVEALAKGLRKFSDADGHDGEFRSFVALFPSAYHVDEAAFERELWELLANLHSFDQREWPSDACREPGAPDFRFFFHARPWFVVGMSPTLERASRRASFPAFAFNPSAMFDKLRSEARYDRFSNTVRARDARYSGVAYEGPRLHPELGDAPQYAGRDFDESWRCPLPVPFGNTKTL